MIPIEDLTDVTLAIEDTDEDDEDDENDEEDLTDVTLVCDDTYWRLGNFLLYTLGTPRSQRREGRRKKMLDAWHLTLDDPPHIKM